MVTWAFDPREGETDFCVWISDVQEYDFILERGYATLNGVQAVPVLGPETCVRACGRNGESFMRLRLPEPFSARMTLELAA
jgi:hypothetical protein